MKKLFKTTRFKILVGVIAFILVGAFLAAANGHGETAQSTVIGTVFAPCHYVAQKIADGIDNVSGNVSGNAAYEKEISSLKKQIGDLQAQLVDYQNLKKQNELYKEFLELKEENKDYKFTEASIIGRDSADVYRSFTISKGTANGVAVGDAVLYGKYLVGVIDKSYPDYSIVKTVYDVNFNVSVYELLSGEISYVTGNAALAKEKKCKMANLNSATKITYGSIICTAGIGGTVPKGLLIGTVDEISDEETDISSYAVITPGVDVENISSCLVLTDYNK